MGNDANPSGGQAADSAQNGFQFYMVLIMLVLGLLGGAYVSKSVLQVLGL